MPEPSLEQRSSDDEEERNSAFFAEHFPELASHFYADIPRGCYATNVERYFHILWVRENQKNLQNLQLRYK